jgi:hypothetical protein
MILNQQLIPGAQAVFTFNGSVDLGSSGDYPLEATAIVSGDLRTYNDTTSVVIYRYDKPVVDFGLEPTEYVEDVSFDIDAGYSPYYTYQWQDTATGHLYTATGSGLCHVTATDTRTGCFDRDSVMVYLIYSDVGVTWSDMPSNGCTGEFEQVRVRVTNLGPSVIGSSAPIYIAAQVNGSAAIIDTLLRTGNFNPGAELEMEFSGKINVTEGGESRIAFYTLFGQDRKPVNDSLVVAFNALASPEVDLGDVNGALNVDLPYQLDAGTGHKSYLWQDNSTAQTYMVNADGIYWVTVTGQNDCRTTKTVRINMPVGTNNIEATGNIILYPNPSDGLFNLSVNGTTGSLTVRILNNQGQVVYIRECHAQELTDEMIDVQHLPRGMYHLLVQSGNRTYQGKLVIQ